MSQKTAAMVSAEQVHQGVVDPQEVRQQYQKASEEWDYETSQKRRVLYADVEELIERGFLAHKVQVGSLSISLRSLLPVDTFMLSHRVGYHAGDLEWKTWTVASTVWMINGTCLLDERDSASKVYQIVSNLPRRVVDTLFTVVLGLYNRTSTALMRTEAYCYEPYSRVVWKMAGRDLPTKNGGIPGIEKLGANHVQKMWMAFNLTEDDREQLMQEWAAAKLVASAQAPKGIRKLNESDRRLQEQENHRRKEVIDKMVQTVLFGDVEEPPQEKWRVRVQGQVVEVPAVKAARTADELQEEFRAWVAGEKDWHDIIVDTYKARIRAKFESERKAREEALSEVQREVGVSGNTHLVGYTLDQIREIRPDLISPRASQRKVVENGAPAVVYQKWLASDPNPGRLQADQHGVWETPLPPKKPLHDQVAERKPSLSTSPDETGGGD